MAKTPKRPATYDLKAADRRRDLMVKVGLTAVVIIFAVAMVFVILHNKDKAAEKASGDAAATAAELAIRAAKPDVLTAPGSTEPKAVLSLYEDFQCPHCGLFEKNYQGTIDKLIDNGVVAVDYYPVSILGGYSTRASNAAYCVADADKTPTKDVFRRFHSALFANQPAEGDPNAPDNDRLIEFARQAGVAGEVPGCIKSGKFNAKATGAAKRLGIKGTPTVRLNGKDVDFTDSVGNFITTDAFVGKIREVVGDAPGLAALNKPKP
ncbi:MAG: thioredoxin domain-containing protein [Mycolicibacterium insubricum]|nr:thioredoxin domain-containing protein [Mycobacterium sp.]